MRNDADASSPCLKQQVPAKLLFTRFTTTNHSRRIRMADPVHHVSTAQSFSEILNSNTYVVVDFTAAWCGPCKAIAPAYATIAKSNSIPGFLAFTKVDVDEVQQVAQQYRVSAMPTFMFFKDGKQVAVHGQAMIQGANVKSLQSAVDKLAGLAKKKQEEKAQQ